MGIDIFFTDQSLRDCSYALCADHRKTFVEVVYNDTGKGIPYWQLRRIRRSEFKHEDITLPTESPLFAYEYRMRKMGEERPHDLPEELGELGTLIAEQNKRDILLKEFVRWAGKQEFEQLVRYCLENPNDESRWIETAWNDHLTWEQRMDHCQRCPVAPLDEGSCSLRFSNYPSMQYFKVGLLYLIDYAERFKDKKFEPGPFSFRHLDREKGETPRDKLIELWEYCAGTAPKKTPEEFFNEVYDVLTKSIQSSKKGKKDLETTGHRLSTECMPFVDEFLAKCVYRDEPYRPAEAEELLPILETMDELGDQLKNEAKRRETYLVMDAFQYRLRQLIKAMRMAKKFNIEFGMSY